MVGVNERERMGGREEGGRERECVSGSSEFRVMLVGGRGQAARGEARDDERSNEYAKERRVRGKKGLMKEREVIIIIILNTKKVRRKEI